MLHGKAASIVFVPTTVYYSDEEFYYVDMGEENGFKAGDYVVRPESSDRYQIGRTASLSVYNINSILFSNKLIYWIPTVNIILCRKNANTTSVYDHIVRMPPWWRKDSCCTNKGGKQYDKKTAGRSKKA